MPSTGFVDIHCHMLPGIDDGAPDWDASLAMAQMALGDGIHTVVATPHQLGTHRANDGRTIRALAAEMQSRLDSCHMPLRVLPGGDVRIEPDLVELVRGGEVVSLADQRRHVLLELPHDLYIPLDRLLEGLSAAGMSGILSHPERNRGIQREPSVVGTLVDGGCLMQVTAGSLLGDFGARVQELTEWLVEQQLVHFVSTDAHNTVSRRPVLRPAYERLIELTDVETATQLCCVNPGRVAAGQHVAIPKPEPRRRGLSAWLGWR